MEGRLRGGDREVEWRWREGLRGGDREVEWRWSGGGGWQEFGRGEEGE